MGVQDICAIIGTAIVGIGALGAFVSWIFGIGNKLGGIEKNTEATAEGLVTLNSQMNVVESHLDAHSTQLNEQSTQLKEQLKTLVEHSGKLNDLRDDMTDLQNRVPRKA